MDVDRVWLVALPATCPSKLWLHCHRSVAPVQAAELK
jgi:hypothetical protein